MTHVEYTLDIQAPIDAVFAAATDPRRAPEWNHEVVEVADVSPGPTRVGTQWRQPTMMGGRVMNLICRVIHYDPPREGVLTVSGDQRARIALRCASIPAGTRLTQSIDFDPPGGLLGKLAGGL